MIKEGDVKIVGFNYTWNTSTASDFVGKMLFMAPELMAG